MKEKCFKINVILLFAFLSTIEIGIIAEILWHGWGGFGGVSMEYTEKGELGYNFLSSFIPESMLDHSIKEDTCVFKYPPFPMHIICFLIAIRL